MITHPSLAAMPHGFFGRQGGASSGDFASLNTGGAVGDDPTLVEKNRAQVAAALGFDSLVIVRQVHSTTVVVLKEPPAPGTEADAMVTSRPGLLLGILTADCAPILLADPDAGVVGAAHAGWKGACGGIAYGTVMAMVGLGADPKNIRAVIGPTISGPNYEVGPETAAQIVAADSAAARHISIPPGKTREHFDIPGLLREQLLGAGLESVADLGQCTYAQPDAYFSHRYATHHGTRTGRQIAVIGLR
jgi:YfiH family protein